MISMYNYNYTTPRPFPSGSAAKELYLASTAELEKVVGSDLCT